MSGNTLDINAEPANSTNDNTLVSWIPWMWEQWKLSTINWETQMLRTRDYLYAVRTNTTDNMFLPFSNNTTVPKLAQLRSTLHARYMKSLFGSEPWFQWVAEDNDSADKDKAEAITAYVKTKLRQSKAMNVLSLLIRDWIETGNCFAKLIWTDEAVYDPVTGKRLHGYVGPKIERVSYLDIKCNLTADSFYSSPKVVRYLKSIGELDLASIEQPELGITPDMVKNLDKKKLTMYGNFAGTGLPEIQKSLGYSKDGFNSYMFYQNYQFVEILEFTGDLYYNGTMYKNHVVTILNRQYVIRNQPSPSWSGSSYLYHAAWQTRPDNLMGMGPLDNIVGMQYKLDKLENIRADMFDAYANPILRVKGNYEQEGELGELGVIFTLDENGALDYLRPDPLAMTADTQMMQTMSVMEMMALVPPESSGFRQPGEKTAFEVSSMVEAAAEAYNNKVKEFEETFLEPLLNDFLEMARRNITGTDVISSIDNAFNATKFMTVRREDLMAVGKLTPMGSRYASNQVAVLQSLNLLLNSAAAPLINPHISRIGIAKLISNMANLDHFKLVQDDIGIVEDAETQVMMQVAQKKAVAAQAAQDAPPDQGAPMAQVGEQSPMIEGNLETGELL